MRTSRTALEIRWPRRPSSSSTPSSTPSTVISGLKASNLNCRCRSTGLHHCRAAVLAASGTDRLRELAVPRAPGALAKPDRIGPAVSGGAGSCDSGSRVASAQSMVASFIERMISNIDSQSAPSWPRRVCGGCSWPGSGQRRWHSWIRLRPAGSSCPLNFHPCRYCQSWNGSTRQVYLGNFRLVLVHRLVEGRGLHVLREARASCAHTR